MVRLGEEVAAALERGAAVVALESTIIAHGLPRPRQPRVAREIEAAVRAAGAVPATIAVLDGEPRVGARRRGAGAARGRRGRRQVQRARPAAGGRARRRRRDDGRRDRAPRRAGRDPRVRHRRPRRRAPRRARDAGTSRPTSATLARTPIMRRLRGREVDPRRRRDARAAGDARRDRRSATAPTRFPGFYLSDSGLRGAVAGRRARGGGRGAARARGARARRARSWWPTRCRPTSSSTPSCTTACSREGLAAAAAQGVARQGRDAVPARPLLTRRPAGGRCEANVELVAAQRARSPREIAAARRASSSSAT